MLYLCQEDLAAFELCLLGPENGAIVDLMVLLSLGRAVDAVLEPTWLAAEEIGWITASDRHFTHVGRIVSDVCRDYKLWRERNGRLPFDDGRTSLTKSHFADKTVVEIGSGMGANLMSMTNLPGRRLGIEPFWPYAQLGSIICRLEGIAPIEIREGSGEVIPLDDGFADIVLCVSSHQYFDIVPALHEMRRVLKQGGELIVIGGTIDRFLQTALVARPVSFRTIKAQTMTVANTLSYTLFGRRVIQARHSTTTSRPIYPSRRAMIRWMGTAGFEVASDIERVDTESIFRGRKVV